MAKSEIGIVIGWADTAIGWIKKGLRFGKVKSIDSSVSSHNERRVNDIVQGVEKNRDKRTNAS